MAKKHVPFVKGRLNSFGYALKGIAAAFRSEINLQWHALSTIWVLAAGFYVGLSLIEWVCISLAIGLVWMAELFNTALEVVVDLVSPEEHPLAGKAKDIAAGAVLVASLMAVIVGLLIFIPYLSAFIKYF